MKKRILLLLVWSLAFGPPPAKVQIFLIGDSTLAPKLPTDAPETGWGMRLPDYLDEQQVLVRNHAVNGRSTKSFLTEGRWAKVLAELRPGDWVFIQFGHNDAKDADTSRYAAPRTDYARNLARFVRETRERGGNPVLLTPVMRRRFDEQGKFFDTHGDYPAAVKAVASELKVPLIDLHARSRTLLEQEGAEASKALFLHLEGGYYPKYPQGTTDDTHFSAYGASRMAQLVVGEVQALGLELTKYLKPFGHTGKYLHELPTTQLPAFRRDTFRVEAYGARGDGLALNTAAINRAIEACHEKGGGTVLVPAGLWLTGPLVLKSNVNLHVAKGALLQFSDRFEHFPLVKTSWEGQEAYRAQPPISATDAENLAITGEGIIDGAGQAWRPVKKEKLTDAQWRKLVASGGVLDAAGRIWYPNEQALKGASTAGVGNVAAGYTAEKAEAFKAFLRPNMVQLTRCRRLLLEGVTLQNSPAWNLHPLLCEHITLRNLTVKNPWYAQNGDGLDLESCRYGLVEHCTFDVGDDGICIKSGRDEEGRRRGVPTENIVVQHCTVFHGHGGFVIGSEMSGGVKNLYVAHCNFLGTDVGLRFKTTRGRGGIVENIYVSDINMTNIPGEAILFDMYYMARDPVPLHGQADAPPAAVAKAVDEGTPQFRNFTIRNVRAQGAETGILIRGLPEMAIRNITIEDAVIQSKKGLVCIEGEDIRLKNVTLLTQDGTVMQLENSRRVVLDQIQYAPQRKLLLKVSGEHSAGIQLLRTDTSQVQQGIELGKNVRDQSIVGRE
ncbi:hypothetical protein GCM10027275_18090 [Rhabdobacter roseus]|uniref:DNA sulfur modification protein DndE n=1 Tax=Rhabdobacter roseus TaxID=1655419 RepID=A0A840TJX2_9BACT|nr:glycosyl hydrolase family 28 protein [Rhabdobacter roseus]MBB5283731.1 DNA sulfur modification protein DndE [Rhabdobacter roseus]